MIDLDDEIEGVNAESGKPEGTFSVGIIGTGITVETLRYAFTNNKVDVMVVDDMKYHLEDLIEWKPNITFICTPVIMNDDGLIEASELESTVFQLLGKTNCGVVIKTPLTPDLIERLCKMNEKIVYSPDIAFETDTMQERINPQMVILGGVYSSTQAVQEIFYRFSTFMPQSIAHVSAVEASIIHMCRASYLEMKSVFFNQLFDVVDEFGGDYTTISNYIAQDHRIGPGMNRVPNFDYTRGCNRKEYSDYIKMLTRFNKRFTLLQEVDRINNGYVSRGKVIDDVVDNEQTEEELKT